MLTCCLQGFSPETMADSPMSAESRSGQAEQLSSPISASAVIQVEPRSCGQCANEDQEEDEEEDAGSISCRKPETMDLVVLCTEGTTASPSPVRSSPEASAAGSDTKPGPELPYPTLAPVAFFCLKQTTRPRSWCLWMVCNPYPFCETPHGVNSPGSWKISP